MKKFILSFFICVSTFAATEAQLRLFKEHNIVMVTKDIDEHHLNEFIGQLRKFPVVLMKEMLKKGARIHLLEGTGVTEDPTWGGGKNTFDGRGWDHVPGAGGSPSAHRPTRIVVNRLYEGHGSVNLFLHEHGHALDSTYKTDGVSSSKEWRDVLRKSPNAERFLEKICIQHYCLVPREGFSELFARYHESLLMRREIEKELPLVARFFQNFTSIKNLPKVSPQGQPVSEN